jgi:hypothetical protein
LRAKRSNPGQRAQRLRLLDFIVALRAPRNGVARHRQPFIGQSSLAAAALLGPHQYVVLALELDDVGGGKHVLAGLACLKKYGKAQSNAEFRNVQ